ncbi:hypothetical protein N7517_002494 [Penicillium concentricum]|uniref:Glutathione S-transferase n=1 Tax=Penicillium concentricum TaxID=293559 RepID=A0A9W9SXJ4_9EURO|nr:uncharacterized protein N7517_002494 [Penicillium concentricum]KAJ5384583.1 hypothetical protein N7517_002494 [Penicillium concentricum]
MASKHPSPLRSLVCLRLPYKAKGIDISSNSNTQKEEWFLKINPNGRIPALLDGSLRVFESGAIMTYLVDKYDTDRKVRADNPPSNHFRLFANTRSDYAIRRFVNETKRLYSVLESRLKESPYLAGEKYTIADIASFAWVRNADMCLEIDLSEFPALKRWVEEIDKRAAVQKGVNVPRSGWTPEQKAEYFRNCRAKVDAMTTSDQH